MSLAHREVMESILLLKAKKDEKQEKGVGNYCIEVLHMF
jgi:hypothetical protein